MTNMGKNGENTGGRHNKWTETAEAAGLLFGAHAGWRSLLAAPGDTAAAWMRFGGFAVWAGLVAALVVVGHQLQDRGSTHFNPTWPLVRTYPSTYPSTSGRPR